MTLLLIDRGAMQVATTCITFLFAPVVLDLDRLLAQSFANLEEMP